MALESVTVNVTLPAPAPVVVNHATAPPGVAGADGASAYAVAVANGFVGNEAAWLASLQGLPGDPGADAPAGAVVSNITGIAGADAVTNLVTLTQAEYDAIGSPAAGTLYVIV